MEKTLEDIRRARKTEKELKNKRRPWFLKRYLGRDLMQWSNLYLGLFLIILTLRNPVFSIADLFMMIIIGINISIWLWGGIMNTQRDFIEELIETSKKTLDLARRAMRLETIEPPFKDTYFEMG